MPWQAIMLFQNLLAALFIVNSRAVAKRFKNATLPLNLMIYGVIGLSGLVYAATKGLNHVNLHLVHHYLGFFLFAGLCFAVSNVISYIVFEYVDAAIAGLLSTLNTVAAVALSTVLIGEGLSFRQIIGAVILLLAMQLIVTINVSKKRHKLIGKAIILSVAASLFYAFATVTEKYLLNRVNLPTYLTFGWGLQFGGVALLCGVFGKSVHANFGLLKSRQFWNFAFPASLLRMFGGLLYIFSLKLANNLSLISVVAGLKVVLAALLAAVILKETQYIARKLEAAVLAALGIGVMFWK